MASKEFDPLANLKPYQGESFDAPTTSLGAPQTGDQSSLRNILENYGWVLPAVGIPAVGAYGAMKGYDLYQKNFGKESNLPDEETPPKKSIRDRFIGQPSTPPGPQTSIEKQLGGLDINTLPKDQRELINTLNDAERKRMAKQQTAINAINDASKGKIPLPENTMPTIELASPIKTTAPVAPVITPISTPEVPTVADLGKQAVGVAPVEAPSTTTQIATEATQKKSTGRPKGSVGLKDTPETWQKLTKEGVVFLPGYGPGDNSLYNTYGAEGRKAILEKYNQGKPLGSDENYKELNKKLRLGVPPSDVPELMARLPSAEEAGNYGKLGKQMKVGGVLGLGLLASQLANAKSNTEAKQVLGEALLPLGLTPSTLQSGVLPPEIVQQMMAERQKLGSPFRSVPPPQ